jgi:hypothetical protein
LASIKVLVIKMSGRLVGQKNLRSMRKINQRDRLVGQKNLRSLRKINQRVDMENKIDSVMASSASGEGNLLDEYRVVPEVD